MVSVIIPNYNHAQYVGDAIQSVLDQNYPNLEIIVVDDGSTDHSSQVVEKFGDRVIFIVQKNQGLSAARNTGIKIAKGKYIGLLDADDMYEEDYLTSMMSLLEGDPDAKGVYCGYRFVDQGNLPLPQIENRLIPPDQLFQALADGNFLVPESMFVHRECYERSGTFDEKLSACEDWDMWLRITKQFKIIGSSHVLTRHRVLPGSMSANPKRMLENRLNVLEKHFGPEPTGEEKGKERVRRAYGRAYLAASTEYLQSGDEDQAERCFYKMVVVCPDLLDSYETFYQLGCGDQPKGYMGDFASLDLQRNAQILLSMLNRLFGNPTLNSKIQSQKRSAYAHAYISLALLNYGARQFQQTRHLLLSACKTNPKFVLKGQIISIWLKSLLGVRILALFKGSSRRKIVSL